MKVNPGGECLRLVELGAERLDAAVVVAETGKP